ncbi:potassium channel subfamily K member 16-like isoform X4 [Bolinopsis microptera]|uniref:potassium channel subfamily K member 16-like isoform X2 n=1 Tax=Bolinopsis microptera TaxID=2820187 RepID=UPI00307B0F2C
MSDKKLVFGKWKYSLLLLVVNIVYIYLGSLVFIYIEAAEWEKEDIYHKEYLNHLKTHMKKPDEVLPKLLELQKEMCVKDNNLSEEEKWTFTGSFTFCLSILSTIGYGVMSPHDTLSRGVTMLYALFGLPIYAVYLNQAMKALTKFTSALSRLGLWFCRKRKEEEEENDEEKEAGDVSDHKTLNCAQWEDTTESMNINKGSKDEMQHDSEYRKLSSEDCLDHSPHLGETHSHEDQNTLTDSLERLRNPVYAAETTVETLLSSGSGNSIEKLSDVMPSLMASEEDGRN